MKYKARLMEEDAVRRALTRLSYEILEKSSDMSKVVLVGIRTRGVPLARYIAENIRRNASIDVPVAELDITLYRDDLSRIADMPEVKGSKVDFPIEDMTVAWFRSKMPPISFKVRLVRLRMR